MKRLIALALLLCGTAAGTQERPKQIRVSLQFIEVAQPALTEMLAGPQKSGQAFHEKAFALSKEGKAKIMETCMVICRSGEKASLETIREEIYPTEYAPPELPCGNPSNKRFPTDSPMNPAFRAPTAFNTRNTGVTLAIEASSASNGTVDLQLSPEIVTRLRVETWMEHVDEWGDGSMRQPIFAALRLNTAINVPTGKFQLVSVLTPKEDGPVPEVSRKVLVFVRADVLSIP